MSKTLITSDDPKGRHAVDLFRVAYNKSQLDEVAAQKLNENGGDFQAEMMEIIRKYSTSNQFADEEVDSEYGYLSGYKPEGEDLDRQISVLHDIFPGLGDSNAEYLQQVKSGAIKVPQFGEKFFAIPNWVKNSEIFGSTYGEALQKVLDLIKKDRNGKFMNYREGQLGSDRLRQSERSIEAWKKLSEDQGNPDILIVAAQFGIRHRGRSVRRAREVFAGNEFDLGAFVVGIMILAHPERLRHYDDLWIDCAGDEYRPDDTSEFCDAPYFLFSLDEVKFDAYRIVRCFGRCGSASGFLPECLIA